MRAVVGKRPAFYYELEIELGPDGRESDLERVAEALLGEHGLQPEPCSKFVRALEMLRLRGTAVEGGLSDEERRHLTAYEAGADAELARRAAAVLSWASGLPTRDIVARTGLSSGRVRFWIREFRAKRMGIFAPGAAEGEELAAAAEPAVVASPAAPAAVKGTSVRRPHAPRKPSQPAAAPAHVATPATPPPVTEPARQAPETPDAPQAELDPSPKSKKGQRAAKEGLPTVGDFSRVHGVNGPRARVVCENALVLFDALRKVHGLPRKRRKLVRTAALLATVGASQDSVEPERAGRDLILAQPLHDVSTEDRLELACIVALQRDKMKPNKEPALEALEPKRRKEVIALACLLQIASALTYDGERSTRILATECKGSETCTLTLEGPAAEADTRRANGRARYWRENLKHELTFAAARRAAEAAAGEQPAAAPPEAPAEPAGPVATLPPVEPDEPMAEAGRKVMFTHFMKMLANEDGTRKGEDIEFLHDMRVSTRRLRAAYRVFEPFYEKPAIARFNKELRRAGATLGAVRDLDVLIEKASTYEASLAPETGLSLAPLLGQWAGQREAARARAAGLPERRRLPALRGKLPDVSADTGRGCERRPARRAHRTPGAACHPAPDHGAVRAGAGVRGGAVDRADYDVPHAAHRLQAAALRARVLRQAAGARAQGT